jgi:hypothetical protein
VNAKDMRQQYGKALIGCEIYTFPYGEYPGGWATVTEIDHDPAAPEIPITVKHPTFGDIGIFEYEDVILREDPYRAGMNVLRKAGITMKGDNDENQ